jgi:hypothetical protein
VNDYDRFSFDVNGYVGLNGVLAEADVRIYARPRVPASVIDRMSAAHQQLLRLPWHET